MNAKANKILAAGGQAIMRWPPSKDGTTWCNVAVNFVAKAAGFDGFRGMVANEMVSLMEVSADFCKVGPEDGQKLATDGRLVIAGVKDEPHGHVAVLCPGSDIVYSSKWRKYAPTVMNVGKTNGISGANWNFSKEPTYFAYIEATV